MQQLLSATGKRWLYAFEHYSNGAYFAQKLGLPDLVGSLLLSRGVDTPEKALTFLEPTLKHLPSPSTLMDINPTVQRLQQAIEKKEKIAIFGDYDVDGACAAALALRYFRQFGLTPLLYVPDRLKEGYGPNPNAMKILKEQEVDLVLTVDCGIQAFDALTEAQNLGLEVIVTDHHKAGDKLPPCLSCVNPNRKDDISELQSLCGTGVIFYVFMALNQKLRTDGYFIQNNITEPDLRQWLDLVALATICDIMPLVGVNRVLVSKGLQVMSRWQNKGLHALATCAGVKSADTYACGFQLGPRINAAGRVDECTLGARLLSTDNEEEAQRLASQAHQHNITRQEIEQRDLEEALQQAEMQCTQGEPPSAIVVQSHLWHPGTIGIVAARLKEKYHRPAFVFSVTNGIAKGSGRSVPAVDLGEGILSCDDIILNGGGHKMAGGLSLAAENIPAFQQKFTSFAEQAFKQDENAYIPELVVDASLSLPQANVKMLDVLNNVAPFGPDNNEPLMLLENVMVSFLKPVGQEGKHYKLTFTNTFGDTVSAMCFSAAETPLQDVFYQAKMGKKIDVVGHLRHNEWQGVVRADFHVKDARLRAS